MAQPAFKSCSLKYYVSQRYGVIFLATNSRYYWRRAGPGWNSRAADWRAVQTRLQLAGFQHDAPARRVCNHPYDDHRRGGDTRATAH